MKRRSTSHSRGLPLPSVPLPSTRTTPTKPLKSVRALGSPPVPGTVESAGPGRLKWSSGPPNGLGMRAPPGMGRGSTLGRLRSSRSSRDGLAPAARLRGGLVPARGARRGGGADVCKTGRGWDHMVALLLEGGLRYNENAIRPRRADRAPGGCRAGEDFAWRRSLTGRFAFPSQSGLLLLQLQDFFRITPVTRERFLVRL